MRKITDGIKTSIDNVVDRVIGIQKKVFAGRFGARKCQENSPKEGALLKAGDGDIATESEGDRSNEQRVKGCSISQVDDLAATEENRLGEEVRYPSTELSQEIIEFGEEVRDPPTDFSQKIIESTFKVQMRDLYLNENSSDGSVTFKGGSPSEASKTGMEASKKPDSAETSTSKGNIASPDSEGILTGTNNYRELFCAGKDLEQKLGFYFQDVVQDLLASSADILDDCELDKVRNINEIIFDVVWNLSGFEINEQRAKEGVDKITNSKAKALFDIYVGNIPRKIAYMRVKQENTGKPPV